MDYKIITTSKRDGKGGTQKAVEVFNARNGKGIAIIVRAPYETQDAWIARAFAIAAERVLEAA